MQQTTIAYYCNKSDTAYYLEWWNWYIISFISYIKSLMHKTILFYALIYNACAVSNMSNKIKRVFLHKSTFSASKSYILYICQKCYIFYQNIFDTTWYGFRRCSFYDYTKHKIGSSVRNIKMLFANQDKRFPY